MIGLLRKLRLMRRRFNHWVTGEMGEWPPRLDEVVDWECGRCGALKSEIIRTDSGCPNMAKPKNWACPMWPVYRT